MKLSYIYTTSFAIRIFSTFVFHLSTLKSTVQAQVRLNYLSLQKKPIYLQIEKNKFTKHFNNLNTMCILCLLLCLLTPFQTKASRNYIENKSRPTLIDVEIQINKIYDINTVNETYIIDGYLVANWKNPESENKTTPAIYENQLVEEEISNGLWVPAFEFINVIGSRDISNKRIALKENGQVTYNERFRAVFTGVMDFRSFPFDTQKFSIQLEAFSYDNKTLVFSNDEPKEPWKVNEMSEEWEILSKKVYVNSVKYPHLDKTEKTVFSRYNIDITASRKTSYYIWQFIVPLFLIIIISWSVFWIPDFTDKLATSFTLMLTVVAFNFNTSSILPKLPYRTLIESLTTLGYLTIFVSLLVVVFGHSLTKNSARLSFPELMEISKYIIPISFILITLSQFLIFLFPS